MRIGIGMPNQVQGVRGDELPSWAIAAESAGFSSLGTVGRLAYPGVMDTVALLAFTGWALVVAVIVALVGLFGDRPSPTGLKSRASVAGRRR